MTRNARHPEGQRGRSRGWLVVIFAIGWLLALWRQPLAWMFEEPTQFVWRAMPDLFGWQGGYLQVFAHLSYAVASPFGPLEVLGTRIIAATAIALVGVYLASDALAPAIPNAAVRAALALSLSIYPVSAGVGPYMGPQNSQWWFSVAVVAIALARPRRWHWPVLFLAGLTGIAPLVALPAFRDRRGIALAAAIVPQGYVWWESRFLPGADGLALHMDPTYLVLALALAVALMLSGLPPRTRLAFAYLGLAEIAMGGVLHGMIPGNDRYLTGAWVALALGISATAAGVLRLAVRRVVKPAALLQADYVPTMR